jgi:dienelactone hydrolase
MVAKLAVLVLVGVFAAQAGVVGKEVTYTADNMTMKGYLAYNGAVKEPHPGILVVHEWWGNNDYSRKRVNMLAELGYVALAIDMYGEGKLADNPHDAGNLAGEVMKNVDVMNSRFISAMEFLKNDTHVNPTMIGAIGYCFGGGVVLAMARAGTDLKAVVSFHGSLATQNPARKGNVKARILVCNGKADKFVSADDIKKFKDEMKAAGAEYKFVEYARATHAFTNLAATELGKKFNMPIAYNQKADKKSWSAMVRWFKDTFKY